jgi:hypothetical protein
MVILTVVTLAVVLAIGAGTALASGAMHQTSDVYRFDDMSDVGDASLVRTNSGVSMTVKSSVEGELTDFGALLGEDFTPGDATTNWWIVFNNPGNCSSGVCGEDDVLDNLFGGDPNNVMVDVLFATGHVAGSQWRAAARLNEGDTSGSILPLFGLGAVGLNNAMEAEIHLIVRSHGPATNLTPDELADAISSVGGGCGTNICGDPQFAVFPAP